jgi:tetratricopeptide (TPR) repeat protein
MRTRGFIQKEAVVALLILASVLVAVFYWRTGSEDIPGDYEVRKGNYRLEDGQYEQAISEFSKALTKTPDHVDAHFGLAITYMQTDRIEEALTAFDKVLEINPENGIAFADRGILLDRMGRYEEALASYKKALTVDPEMLEGPGWLWRFLHNVSEKPPNITTRALYLQEELAKPPEERRLSNPEEDAAQRMYKVD